MSQHHHHDHTPKEVKALWIALVLNAVLMVGETVAGVLTGSLALLSDAGHMVSDVAALSIALVASYLARRPTTPNRSFGFSGAQVLGASANSVGLLIISIIIFKEAFERLATGAPNIPAIPVLIVGIVGLVINVGSAYYLAKSGSNNLNIRGALAHMVADALGSVGAIVAGVCILLGYPVADPIISMVIGIIILWSAYGIMKDCLHVMLGFTPKHLDSQEIIDKLMSLKDVWGVHDLHVWSIDGHHPLLSAHIVVPPDLAFPDELLTEVRCLLEEQCQIGHTTIQLESVGMEYCCGQQNCV